MGFHVSLGECITQTLKFGLKLLQHPEFSYKQFILMTTAITISINAIMSITTSPTFIITIMTSILITINLIFFLTGMNKQLAGSSSASVPPETLNPKP